MTDVYFGLNKLTALLRLQQKNLAPQPYHKKDKFQVVPGQEQSLKLNDFFYEFKLLLFLIFHTGDQQPQNTHPLQIYTNQIEVPLSIRKSVTWVHILPEIEEGCEKIGWYFFSPSVFLYSIFGGLFLR